MPPSMESHNEALRRSREETRAAYGNRALLHAEMLDVLEEELGLDRAVLLMKRAIRRRGEDVGRRYAPAVAAGDLGEVARIFVTSSPAEGSLFEPAVEEEPSGGRMVLRMSACPLADAWRQAGYPPERVDLLCEVAAEVDHGTFEGAGLELTFLDRQACPGSKRCLLELRLPGRP